VGNAPALLHARLDGLLAGHRSVAVAISLALNI